MLIVKNTLEVAKQKISRSFVNLYNYLYIMVSFQSYFERRDKKVSKKNDLREESNNKKLEHVAKIRFLLAGLLSFLFKTV